MDKEEKWVEDVAASLIREFLFRKGLKSTLQCLDYELPREENSINNRLELIQELHLEKLVKKNKVSSYPLNTLLELITKDLQTKQEKSINNINTRKNKKIIKKNLSKSSFSVEDDETNQKNCKIISGEVDLKNFQNFETQLNCQEEIENTDKISQTSLDCNRYFTFTKISENKGNEINLHSKIEQFQNSESNLASENLSYKCQNPKFDPDSKINHKTNFKGLNKKAQFGPIHSSLEHPSRQRRHILNEDPLKTKLLRNKTISNRTNSIYSKNILETKSEISKTEQKEDNSVYPTKTYSVKSTVEKIANQNTNDMNDLELCDLSDSDIDFQPINRTPVLKTFSRSITISEACEIKKLLFGNTTTNFGAEWRGQAFTFNESESVCYGITQNKGGPCGILAAVQSHILIELLFNSYHDNCINGCLRPTTQACNKALIRALSTILWRAGLQQKAVVALPSGRQTLDMTSSIAAKLQYDGLTEQLLLYKFNCFNSLSSFIKEKINMFQDQGKDGCILFLYSVIFSHKIERLKNEMDDPHTNLIGRHGYCTQEMVNLLIVGQAVSNVFDDDLELNTGGIEKTILHGIKHNSDVGLLSLFEHYNSCKVGNNLKNPKYPIWIVLSESHFSVLFAVSLEEIENGKPFNLFYYDGLIRQTEEICLTIDPSYDYSICENDLISPIEHCIRTKWNGAKISWNTEPLL